jgi:beta-galactosidase GanA
MRWLVILLALLLALPAAAEDIPRLERRGEATQLIVDGAPFLILGGELGNSEASSREAMRAHWPRLRAMNLNTVLAPVYWELVEPEEGRFDFATVDALLEDARAHDMRLVLLWFGTWKNSMSSYVPAWVKRDTARFPRTTGAGGRAQEIISAFSTEARDADARAFAALMRHLRQVDGDQRTVIMVQVENEVGFLPFAREGGNGTDLAADERAMASAYAAYVEVVAAAGKREYPLPLFVNGAQGRPGVAPGDYPSGGPLAHLAREWREGALSIDFIAPDIYFPNFAGIVDGYVEAGAQPLFIPEANRPPDPALVANALRSIGERDAIGFSPFAIEDANEAQAAKIGGLYEMLEGIAPLVLAAQAEGRIAGFGNPVAFDGTADLTPPTTTLGGAAFTATTIDPWTPREAQAPSTHGAVLIWLGGEDYLVAGQGVTLTVEPADGVNSNGGRIGFDRVEDGRYEAGQWRPGRRLNGDQTHQGRHVRLPPDAFGVQRFRLYRY